MKIIRIIHSIMAIFHFRLVNRIYIRFYLPTLETVTIFITKFLNLYIWESQYNSCFIRIYETLILCVFRLFWNLDFSYNLSTHSQCHVSPHSTWKIRILFLSSSPRHASQVGFLYLRDWIIAEFIQYTVFGVRLMHLYSKLLQRWTADNTISGDRELTHCS